MPASNKMLKRAEQKKNKDAGIGDKDGKMPAKDVRVATKAKCNICMTELIVTKTNAELKMHMNKHAKSTFEICFPGQTNPDAK
jgi:hypothetical protein